MSCAGRWTEDHMMNRRCARYAWIVCSECGDVMAIDRHHRLAGSWDRNEFAKYTTKELVAQIRNGEAT